MMLEFLDVLIMYGLYSYLFIVTCSVFFFKQKTAYEMRISDWSSDVCSSDLQETVMRRLSAERQAAAVVVNVENGDILALASTPSFDPNAFVGGLSAQAWMALVAHPDSPMLHKALGGESAPGPPFQRTVALAGLDARLVGPATRRVS